MMTADNGCSDPDPDARRVAPQQLELRIHGVSNTPPTSVLGAQEVELVAGDDLTGFYRRKGEIPTTPTCEAYSWGSLNSAAKGTVAAISRAGWLLLLPFALANVAYWARPHLKPSAGKGWFDVPRIGAAVTRIAGLLLTALLITTACNVGVNLMAWQCFRGGDERCPALPSWLGFLANSPWDEPARRIAIGAALPLVLLVLLWLLSRKSLQRYEERPDESAIDMAGGWVRTHLYEKKQFWSGSERLLRLQRLHLALGVSLVVALTAWPVTRATDASWSARSWLVWVAWASIVLMAVVVIVTLLLSADAPENSNETQGFLAKAPGRTLGCTLLVLVVDMVVLLVPYHRMSESGSDSQLLGYGAAPLVVLCLLVLLIAISMHMTKIWMGFVIASVAVCAFLYDRYQNPQKRFVALSLLFAAFLLVAGMLHRWRHDSQEDQRFAWRGAGPGVLLGTATSVGLLYCTAIAVGAANYLNGSAGVGQLIASDKSVTCQADVPDPSQPCTPIQVQRPRNRDSVGADAVATTGDVSLRGGGVTVATGGPATVTSGKLKATRVYRMIDVPPYRVRVPSIRINSGSVQLSDGTLQLEDTVVNGPGTTRVEGAIAIDAPAGSEPALQIAANTDAAGNDRPVEILGTDPGPTAVLSVPSTYIWIASAEPIGTALTVVVLIGAALLHRRKVRGGIGALLDANLKALDLPSDAGEPVLHWDVPGDVRDRMRGARLFAGLAHRVEVLLMLTAFVVMLVTLVALAGALTGREPWHVDLWTPRPGQSHASIGRKLADAGLGFAVGMAALILALGALLQRSATIRRTVGVVWDLTALWPRTAHPFGPPCYAERAVPDLYIRTTWVLDNDKANPPGRVVLSGHSLGSVLAVATIFRLHPSQRHRVGLISYGSQLRLYFGRLFPEVLGPEVLGNAPWIRPQLTVPTADECMPPVPPTPVAPPVGGAGSLAATLTNPATGQLRWVNLFRRTDPLGVRVWSDEWIVTSWPAVLPLPSPTINYVDRYVVEVDPPEPGTPLPPTLHAHSDYPMSPEYQVALGECFL